MRNEGARILSPTDIRNISSYVQKKFADLPQERHAEIIYDAMQRIVSRQLPDWKPESKLKLTTALLRDVVLKQRKPVESMHIFAACLQAGDLEEDAGSRLALKRWTELRLGTTLMDGQFADLLVKAAAMDSEEEIWQVMTGFAAQEILEPDTDENELQSAVAAAVEASAVGPMKKLRRSTYALLSAMLAAGTITYSSTWLERSARSANEAPAAPPAEQKQTVSSLNELPQELRYTAVNKKKLIAYLKNRNSLLAEEQYVNAILRTARKKDINPLLLFAITGQEQGFVPRDHKNAQEIANNPFNVYHSWREYNTTLEDAASIAGNTINRLSRNRPENVEPITWINREYAEDPDWASGVSSLLSTLQRAVSTSNDHREAID
ncbi:hypothetical protein [Paenibacillus sp. GCM10027626]|uniref:hypothetical protein n=1 Tax=Paenibacillus sp. GCM10027626 TaxID=3273411 RepID=UPI0036454F6B